MALVLKDRVKVSTTTTGTGTITLGAVYTGYQAFAAIGNGNTTYYTIQDTDTGDWEVGIGTYSSTGPTLSRDTVLASSNSGNLVSFAVGTKQVFVTLPADKSRTVTSDTPPSNPTNGDNWYNTTDGVTYVYYDDGDTGQWVDTTPYMNTPNQDIDLSSGTAYPSAWSFILDGGSSIISLYPFNNNVDGGLGSSVTTAYTSIDGGISSTAYNVFGECVDGGLSS